MKKDSATARCTINHSTDTIFAETGHWDLVGSVSTFCEPNSLGEFSMFCHVRMWIAPLRIAGHTLVANILPGGD